MTYKRLLILAGLLLVLALTIFACPINVTCPVHDYSVSYFTGQFKFIDGAQMGVYRCSRGHEFLVRCN